ncbi:ArnT family glycosyltransferase [Legionella worsleiensis]|uniref:ArnT family glycosyltransferase n=1 Tax=Legionella worsleiensis TaxID=45076 RepID=UPI000730A9C9|nr:glycosyltransferase family 39 protein [Legionella worsleiensis]
MNTKSDDLFRQKFYSNAVFVLIFLLLCRIIASYFIPLNDSTEARYGEIARKMLETGDWITLQHDYGVPFWAKPPLSVWLSAFSMKIFGVNEFAARLPGLLLSIGVLALIWDLAKKHSGAIVGMASVVVLAGTFYFFLDAGTVMTDPALVFCTTLATVSFWHAVVNQNKIWSYVFFIALGLGLLAKGPIAVVLVGIPIFFWVVLRNEWNNLWKRLPWFKGTVLLLVIALPWYIMAELRTPGFLNYFIIGEHFNRFLTPGWTGDKYGMAHNAPRGMIWVYAVLGVFPWSIIGGKWLLQHGRILPSFFKDDDGWLSFIFICMVGPLVFFTFAGNIIYPYVFPSLPAFALFFTEVWNRSNPSLEKSQWIAHCSLVSGAVFLLATVVFAVKPDSVAKTQKPVVTAWLNQHPIPGSSLVYWDFYTWFSAQFYTSGKVVATRDINYLCQLFAKNPDNYLVINELNVEQIPAELFAKWNRVATVTYKENTVFLMHSPALHC